MWISANIDWVMYVTGALTMTMIQATFAPNAAMKSTFGQGVDGAVEVMMVRMWGLLVALLGALLVCGGYDAAIRAPVLVAALIGKAVFISLILAHGPLFRRPMTMVVIAFDGACVFFYAWYLIDRYA